MQKKILSRRAFVKAAAVGGVAVAVGSLAGCSKKSTAQSEVIKGKSKKQEILYRGDTKHWQAYFAVAK